MNFKRIKNFNELKFSINSYEALKDDILLTNLLSTMKDIEKDFTKDFLEKIIARIYYIQTKVCNHEKIETIVKFSFLKFKLEEKSCLLCDKKLK